MNLLSGKVSVEESQPKMASAEIEEIEEESLLMKRSEKFVVLLVDSGSTSLFVVLQVLESLLLYLFFVLLSPLKMSGVVVTVVSEEKSLLGFGKETAR